MLSLCANHVVLMTDVLFHELVTTGDNSRKRCFNKFPNKTNPVELIPNIGTLLRYELANTKQCTPLIDRRVEIVFKFNDDLGKGTFAFTDDQSDFIKKREQDTESNTTSFFELAMLVSGFFQNLKQIPYKKLADAIDEAKQEIISKYDKVRNIYSDITKNDRPKNRVSPDLINDDWACFRYVQVRVLYSLNLLLKYQGKLPAKTSKKFWRKIEHELHDSEYVMLGALSGALASNEKQMISNYKSICPSGKVFKITRE